MSVVENDQFRIVGAVPPPTASPSPAVKRSVEEIERRVEAIRQSFAVRDRRQRTGR